MERALLTSRLELLTGVGASTLPPEPEAEVPETGSAELRLAALLRDHFQTVWTAVRRFGVPPRSAEDAAQEVFIIASNKLGDIRPGRERQFLYAVAVRVAANFRRGSIHLHEAPGPEALLEETSLQPPADVLLDQKRRRELLDRILDGMTDDLRTVFVLFELEGLSAPEIAETLQIPAGTVSSRLRRAREQFGDAVRRASGRLR